MKKIFQKILPALLLINFSFSQEVDIAPYLYMLRVGDLDKVKTAVDSLLKIYPNSSNLKFLKANILEDANEAVKIYRDIVLNNPESEYADESQFKIFQYHYAKGEFEQAKREFERLKTNYPSSPFANILVVFPSNPKPPIFSGSDEKVQKFESVVNCAFVIQVGAFVEMSNAEKEKKFFEERGFPVELRTKVKDGKLFYLVWVGCFEDRKDAEAQRGEIKKKFNRESIVISTSNVK